MICAIAKSASLGKYYEIDDIELSNMFKWKIAYLYGGMDLIPIYNKDMLMKAAQLEGMEVDNTTTFSQIQSFLMEKRGNDFLVEILTMALNFVTEYLYDRFVVFRGSIDTNDVAKKEENK